MSVLHEPVFKLTFTLILVYSAHFVTFLYYNKIGDNYE